MTKKNEVHHNTSKTSFYKAMIVLLFMGSMTFMTEASAARESNRGNGQNNEQPGRGQRATLVKKNLRRPWMISFFRVPAR